MTHGWMVWAPVAMLVAAAMEPWAALLHGRVWHRWLWTVHRSHHRRRTGGFERNDLLSALHAPLAIAAVLYGCAGPAGWPREVIYGVGVGMSAFGAAYLIAHDGLVHGRWPVRPLLRLGYFRRIVRAHRKHHRGAGGPPYGLFLGPWELARHRVTRRRRRSRPSGPRSTPSVPPSTGRGPS
jgi:beta-carotene 3-hydroxylase